MPLPIQITLSRYGGPVVPLELRWQRWRRDGLPDLEVPEVAGGGHISNSIRRRAHIQLHPAQSQCQSRGDGQRQGGAKHGRALHA